MKKVCIKSGSLLMALLVLFSTMSFTVDKHFCGSILVDKAVFSDAMTCGMEEHNLPVTENNAEEDSCCNEEQIAVEGQTELKISYDELNLGQQVFIASFTWSYVGLFADLPQNAIPFDHYSPPLLVTDIQLMDQVFLI